MAEGRRREEQADLEAQLVESTKRAEGRLRAERHRLSVQYGNRVAAHHAPAPSAGAEGLPYRHAAPEKLKLRAEFESDVASRDIRLL